MDSVLNELLLTVYSALGAGALALLGTVSVKLRNYLKNSRILKFMEAKEKDRSFLQKLAHDFAMAAEKRARSEFDELLKGDKYGYVKVSIENYINNLAEERGISMRISEEDIDAAIEKAAKEVELAFAGDKRNSGPHYEGGPNPDGSFPLGDNVSPEADVVDDLVEAEGSPLVTDQSWEEK